MVRGFSRRFLHGILRWNVPAILTAGSLLAPGLQTDATAERPSNTFAQQSPASAPIPAILEYGKPAEGELAGGEVQVYGITLSAGQYVSVVVEQLGVDIALKSFGPDGNPIAEFDRENRPQGVERGELVAPITGSYTLKVEAKFKTLPGGRYTIRVEEMRPATDKDRSLQEARELYAEAARLTNTGKYNEAESAAQRALEIRQEILGPDHPDIALTLTLLANAAYYKGDYPRAEVLTERSVTMMEKTLGLEHPQTATRLNNLASVYQANGNWVKAELLHKRALEIRERSLSPDHPDIAQSLNNLANVYNSLGDFVSAKPLYLRAIAINEKVLGPTHPNLAYPLGNLGDMYMEEEDYDNAELFLKKALAIREQNLGPDHPLVALLLYNLAEVFRGKGDYAQAEELHRRSLAIRESKLGPDHVYVGASLHKLGNIYFSQKNYEKAESYYRRALAIEDAALGPHNPETLKVVTSLATLYMVKGDFAQAVAFQSRALAGDDYNIDLNLAIGSERQKQAYLATLPEELDRAISLHIRLAPDDPAARDLAATSILRRKGRVLDAMSQSLSSLRSRMDAQHRQLLDQLRDVTVQLARLVINGPQRMTAAEHQEQIKIAETKREQLEVEVSRLSAGFYQRSDPATLAAIQSAIPDHAILIELAVYRPFDPQKEDDKGAYGEPRYVAYVIRRGADPQWKDLGAVQEIDRAVEDLRKALRSPQRADVQQLARALDRKVLQPIRPFLRDSARLLVSPDGELSLIPFEALIDEQGRYLIERHSVTYLTSGRDLLRMQIERPKEDRPLVIADPFFGEPRLVQTAGGRPGANLATANQISVMTGENLSDFYFAPLSGTAQEARYIGSLFPGARVLTGTQASKTALRRVEAPGILHIATHGFFVEDAVSSDVSSSGRSAANQARAAPEAARVENPLLRSGLAFAGANLHRAGDDGILTALEASTLDLWGTKLVTLSACDTGVGTVKNGEGVYGLRRAFVLAGAETLVMSLWPVSDRVARETMTEYYTGLKRGLGRGEALRQAELALLKRKDRRHPFYWASFIQSGEWANLNGHR